MLFYYDLLVSHASAPCQAINTPLSSPLTTFDRITLPYPPTLPYPTLPYPQTHVEDTFARLFEIFVDRTSVKDKEKKQTWSIEEDGIEGEWVTEINGWGDIII